MSPNDFERLGTLFLGKPEGKETPFLLDSRALTTHALIVGMTGSGKTGLGTVLLEEAAIDGIPSIVVDPKGDLASLLLTFPDLTPESFAPWLAPGEDAASVAAKHRDGIAAWGQDGARIGRYASAVERVLYTPGSAAGRPLSLLPSLAPPTGADAEAIRERAVTTASAFLALAGVEADPRAPEHSLFSTVLTHAWTAGNTLDLPGLLRALQQPPFARLGAMDVDAVLPPKDRAALAVRLNGALASPAMAGFVEGAALDIGSLLFGPGGRPRLSVLSIAHLSDADRQFFVAVLLGELLAWMRAQSGTSSLRALFYMDEIAGYFPPVAEPPTKRPMLTLLKQARAFGLGIVLSTQNPVDLDYKGLANTGTWFLGRLQTERDKLRILDGLEGASTESGRSFDRAALDAMLSGMPPRSFLAQSIHLAAPERFSVRWTLSYLRGPLSREETRRLSATTVDRPSAAGAPSVAGAAAVGAPPAMGTAAKLASERPVLPPEIPESFLVRPDLTGAGQYRAGALAVLSCRFADKKAGVEETRRLTLVTPIDETGPRFSDAWLYTGETPEVTTSPETRHAFAPLAPGANRPASWKRWEKAALAHVAGERPLSILAVRELGLVGRPGEGRDAFSARVALALRERRDAEVEKLAAKWQPKVEKARAKVATTARKLEDAAADRNAYSVASGLEVGATVLSAVFGRGSALRGAARVARGARTAQRRGADRERAQADLDAAKIEASTLEKELARAIEELKASWDPSRVTIGEARVLPRKSDIVVERFGLVWVPVPV